MTQQMSSPILVLADQAGDHLTPLARQAVTLAASLTSADVVALSLAATPDVAALSELGATQLLHADLGDGHLDAPQLPLQETPADSEQNQKRCHPSQGMAALLNLVCFIWRIRINHHHG